jgi:hypothetical protein
MQPPVLPAAAAGVRQRARRCDGTRVAWWRQCDSNTDTKCARWPAKSLEDLGCTIRMAVSAFMGYRPEALENTAG